MYNNKRLALSIFWVVLGLVLVVLSVAKVIDSTIAGLRSVVFCCCLLVRFCLRYMLKVMSLLKMVMNR